MTPATVEAGGLALAYDSTGDDDAAATVVLVHGTATARTVWRETVEALGGGPRTIAYDRRAYGDSGAPEPYGGTTVGEQADDPAALIEALSPGRPAAVCGHELGALACLDLVVRRPELVDLAVLIEPPLLWMSPTGTDKVADLREAVASAARDGGAAAAVRAYIVAVGGSQAPDLLGRERLDAALASPRAFAADLAAAASWTGGRRELAAIATPVAVISGSRSAPERQEAARALASMIPGARLEALEAGHFVHLERPAEVAAAIVGGGV